MFMSFDWIGTADAGVISTNCLHVSALEIIIFVFFCGAFLLGFNLGHSDLFNRLSRTFLSNLEDSSRS
jgi:hypothetical protein